MDFTPNYKTGQSAVRQNVLLLKPRNSRAVWAERPLTTLNELSECAREPEPRLTS